MEEGSEGAIERERSTGGGCSTRRWEHRTYCASLTPSYIYLRLIVNYPHSFSISVSVSALQHRCMYIWTAGVPQDTVRETRTVTPQDIRLSNTTTTCVGASALSSEAGAQVSTTAVSRLPDTVSWTSSRTEPECQKARQKVRAGAAPSETWGWPLPTIPHPKVALHPTRTASARSVCACVKLTKHSAFWYSVCVWASVTPVFRSLVVHDAEDEALSWLPNPSKASVDYSNVVCLISSWQRCFVNTWARWGISIYLIIKNLLNVL